jgi:hypothetical protein
MSTAAVITIPCPCGVSIEARWFAGHLRNCRRAANPPAPLPAWTAVDEQRLNAPGGTAYQRRISEEQWMRGGRARREEQQRFDATAISAWVNEGGR